MSQWTIAGFLLTAINTNWPVDIEHSWVVFKSISWSFSMSKTIICPGYFVGDKRRRDTITYNSLVHINWILNSLHTFHWQNMSYHHPLICVDECTHVKQNWSDSKNLHSILWVIIVILSVDTGLAPKMWQIIIFTNDDAFQYDHIGRKLTLIYRDSIISGITEILPELWTAIIS